MIYKLLESLDKKLNFDECDLGCRKILQYIKIEKINFVNVISELLQYSEYYFPQKQDIADGPTQI